MFVFPNFFIYFLFQCILNVCAFFSVQSESMKTAVMFEIFSVEIEISCTINVPWFLFLLCKRSIMNHGLVFLIGITFLFVIL